MGTTVDTSGCFACPDCVRAVKAGTPTGIVGTRVQHPDRGLVTAVVVASGAPVWRVGPCDLCGLATTAYRTPLGLELVADTKPDDLGGNPKVVDPTAPWQAADLAASPAVLDKE